MKRAASIDIGSTFTKGALFKLEKKHFELEASFSAPTSQERLFNGVETVLKELQINPGETEIYFSSSAKGGLKTAAVGIVPELTSQAAELAALSAGARVTDTFSYKLTEEDIDRLKENKPDIILFTGGTDGGCESYNLHNAEMLANAVLDCSIVYAGNRALASKIKKILSSYDFHTAENVLPDLNRLSPESAREKIREIFLGKIVKGKGLDEIVKMTGKYPSPTPGAMFEYVKKIHELAPEFGEFCVIDTGGATTDFYSAVGIKNVSQDVVTKGIPEPEVKRTVEGDLGMRVSASSAYKNFKEIIDALLAEKKLTQAVFEQYLKKLDSVKSFLPESEEEKEIDEILASVCVSASAQRHAGTFEEAYTPHGKVFIQKGKDLRKITKAIGTGGFLSRHPDCLKDDIFLTVPQSGILLLPEEPDFFYDEKYLLPLLANLSAEYPEEAVRTGIKSIKKIK